MNKWLAGGLIVVAALVVFFMSGRAGDPLDGLGGTVWELAALEQNGKAETKVVPIQVAFGKDGRIIWSIPTPKGDQLVEGMCKLSPAAQPKQIEITLPIRAGKSTQMATGTYKFEQGLLTMHLNDPQTGTMTWVFQKVGVIGQGEQ